MSSALYSIESTSPTGQPSGYSVLVPNGRDAAALGQCLLSICMQDIKPKEIIVYHDGSQLLTSPFITMIQKMGIMLVELHGILNSIAAIRLKLLKTATYPHCIFVDDDIILDRQAFYHINQCVINYPAAAFIEGARIEVNGREESETDLKQVRAGGDHIYDLKYGDMALLYLNKLAALQSIHETSLLTMLDKRGMGGEDIVITLMMRDNGFSGMGAPEAFGYHYGASDASYWSRFTPLDAYLKNALQGVVAAKLIGEVYGS